MNGVIQKLRRFGVLPVVRLENAADAVPLADALTRGGLPAAEITFRTPAAAESIRAIRQARPDFFTAAGTVLCERDAMAAADAGAELIVSPGTSEAVVRFCLERGLPVISGVMTPSDIERALALGLTYLKFVPAEAAGGVKMLRALSAPYGAVRFMPTGGIGPSDIGSYLALPSVFACGGSWMVPADAIAAGDYEKIERLTAEAVAAVKEAVR